MERSAPPVQAFLIVLKTIVHRTPGTIKQQLRVTAAIERQFGNLFAIIVRSNQHCSAPLACAGDHFDRFALCADVQSGRPLSSYRRREDNVLCLEALEAFLGDPEM